MHVNVTAQNMVQTRIITDLAEFPSTWFYALWVVLHQKAVVETAKLRKIIIIIIYFTIKEGHFPLMYKSVIV